MHIATQIPFQINSIKIHFDMLEPNNFKKLKQTAAQVDFSETAPHSGTPLVCVYSMYFVGSHISHSGELRKYCKNNPVACHHAK